MHRRRCSTLSMCRAARSSAATYATVIENSSASSMPSRRFDAGSAASRLGIVSETLHAKLQPPLPFIVGSAGPTVRWRARRRLSICRAYPAYIRQRQVKAPLASSALTWIKRLEPAFGKLFEGIANCPVFGASRGADHREAHNALQDRRRLLPGSCVGVPDALRFLPDWLRSRVDYARLGRDGVRQPCLANWALEDEDAGLRKRKGRGFR
jgi:hypothetical protein